jgi:hypothetical protein
VGSEGAYEVSFYLPQFAARTAQFHEGFVDWYHAIFDNPYTSFLPSREWQHGQDVAFLLNQHFITEHDDA